MPSPMPRVLLPIVTAAFAFTSFLLSPDARAEEPVPTISYLTTNTNVVTYRLGADAGAAADQVAADMSARSGGSFQFTRLPAGHPFRPLEGVVGGQVAHQVREGTTGQDVGSGMDEHMFVGLFLLRTEPAAPAGTAPQIVFVTLKGMSENPSYIALRQTQGFSTTGQGPAEVSLSVEAREIGGIRGEEVRWRGRDASGVVIEIRATYDLVPSASPKNPTFQPATGHSGEQLQPFKIVSFATLKSETSYRREAGRFTLFSPLFPGEHLHDLSVRVKTPGASALDLWIDRIFNDADNALGQVYRVDRSDRRTTP